MNSVSGHPGTTYLVTQDIGSKVASFQRLGVRTPSPNDRFFAEIQNSLIEALQKSLPEGVTVQAISMVELAGEILTKAFKSNTSRRNLIVSTCAEIAEPMKGVTFEINRLVDLDGNILGIGPRPGHPSLHDQVEGIRRQADGSGVTIVEDGIFSGSTLQFAVDLFLQNGVRVDEVVTGFSFPQAQPVIEELQAKGVNVISVSEFDNLYEWVPDHDFLPGVPNCGRVVGAPVGRHILPIYSHEGLSYAVPYVTPLGPMSDWASIPTESAAELSRTCFQLARLVYTHLDRLNGGEVAIRDLLGPMQPVSVPIKVGAQDLSRVGGTSMRKLLHALEQASVFDLYKD